MLSIRPLQGVYLYACMYVCMHTRLHRLFRCSSPGTTGRKTLRGGCFGRRCFLWHCDLPYYAVVPCLFGRIVERGLVWTRVEQSEAGRVVDTLTRLCSELSGMLCSWLGSWLGSCSCSCSCSVKIHFNHNTFPGRSKVLLIGSLPRYAVPTLWLRACLPACAGLRSCCVVFGRAAAQLCSLLRVGVAT